MHPDEQVQRQRLVSNLRRQSRGYTMDWQVLVRLQPPQVRVRSPVQYPHHLPRHRTGTRAPSARRQDPKDVRGGKICLTVHFKPLWAKNCPRFGMAHALCLGLAPWLAAFMLIRIAHGFSIYMKFMKRGLWLKRDASQYRKK
ncbi:hypothetical protein FF2_035034 [Malus domestica]